MDTTFMWAFAIIGGPILLLIAAAWARTRAGRRNDRVDPRTPADDPSKGMPGHDEPPPPQS
jgi:hypothetical protein